MSHGELSIRGVVKLHRHCEESTIDSGQMRGFGTGFEASIFHITFYQCLHGSPSPEQDSWNHGSLYSKTPFRKASFTVSLTRRFNLPGS